jgi:hypothetical protein
MKQTYDQEIKGPTGLLRGQVGFSILAVIFVLVVLTAIGYSMANMMAAKQKSVPVTAGSNRAFSIAEGCINWAGKCLSELQDWDTAADRTNTILGGGDFDVAFSTPSDDGTYEYITATCTGRYGKGKRVISKQFKRELGSGCI